MNKNDRTISLDSVITIFIFLLFLIVIFSINVEGAWISSLNDDIIAFYTFNGTTGVVLDSVNGIYNGTAFGVERGVEGIINNSFEFNRTDNVYVNLSTRPSTCLGDLNCSISMWIKTDFVESGYLWFGGFTQVNNSVFLFISSNGTAFAQMNSEQNQITKVDAGNVTNGLFQHIVMTMNTSSILIYLNGTLSMQKATTGTMNISGTIESFGNVIVDTGVEYNGTMDEIGIWNRTLTTDEVSELFNARRTISVALNSPSNNTLSANITYEFDSTIELIGIEGQGTTLNPDAGDPIFFTITNGTAWVYFNNGTLFNNTVINFINGTLNTTSLNISNFPPQIFVWNVLGCGGNNTGDGVNCSFAPSNFTLTVGAINTSSIFNLTTAETATESFIDFITIPSGSTISSIGFTWNGTSRTSTESLISGTNHSLTSTFEIPLVGESIQNFNWNITFSNGFEQVFGNHVQTVNNINLTICGSAPQNVPYINFSYKNETTLQETIRASIASSEWQYYLSSGTINKTLSFDDATERLTNAFCFTPADRTLNVNVDYRYVNTESQQRTFNPNTLVLTNLTSNQTLFLLPTGLSLFSPFNVVTPIGNVIPGVRASVTRTLGGNVVDITSAITDASGFVGFFLNPDATYNIVFSKAGLVDVTVSAYNPKSQTTTVVMGTAGGEVSNGTSILTNTTLEITPLNNSLPNNTVVTFGFNVTSSLTITFISMNITNATGGQLSFVSNAGQGLITTPANTGNLSIIVGRYIVQTTDETVSISKVWTVGQDFIGDYSLFRQLRFFNDYEFSDFIRILLVIAFISGVLIFLSTNEVLDTSESKIAVALLLIWAFSIVSWLDTGLVINSASNNINTLGQFSSQFGIAILSTGVAVFFVFRKVFT